MTVTDNETDTIITWSERNFCNIISDLTYLIYTRRLKLF